MQGSFISLMNFGDTSAVLYRAFSGERLILQAKGSFYLLIYENVVKMIFEELVSDLPYERGINLLSITNHHVYMICTYMPLYVFKLLGNLTSISVKKNR